MADLVGTLKPFATKLFGEDSKIRLRPHHFPFTDLVVKLMSVAGHATARVVQLAKMKDLLKFLCRHGPSLGHRKLQARP